MRENSSPSLLNVTIADNLALDDGGGVFCWDNSNPGLENVSISGNSASDDGGGIFCGRNCNVSFVNVSISGNSASVKGGGLCYYRCSPSLTDVTISDNSAFGGGGVFFDTSHPSLVCMSISNNYATWGGGVFCDWQSTMNLVDVKIGGNSAGLGAGIYFDWSFNSSLENVTINDNSAYGDGGGIYYDLSPGQSLMNVTISNNTSTSYGGGIYCSSSSPNLENVTLTNNSAALGGGIFCWWSSDPSLENCILWNNIPQEILFHPMDFPNSITISCSDIQGGEEGIDTNDNGTVYWLENNIDEYPLFCNPDSSYYRLQLDSPCRTDVCGFMGYTGDTCLGEDVEEQVAEPLQFSLSQNYPNPFNPTTTIEYTLPYPQEIRLEVYNLLGQQVALLAEGMQTSGRHRVTFAGNAHPSGIYLYTLKIPHQIISRKMVLVR
ncbi:MAG: T9SS type A sorting domain-containing protein [Candidatus Delongbacteria bacterium]|nr:T9SS type A sorting domain-containing protein [Candidatus Delongbacteria bacterium]